MLDYRNVSRSRERKRVPGKTAPPKSTSLLVGADSVMESIALIALAWLLSENVSVRTGWKGQIEVRCNLGH